MKHFYQYCVMTILNFLSEEELPAGYKPRRVDFLERLVTVRSRHALAARLINN